MVPPSLGPCEDEVKIAHVKQPESPALRKHAIPCRHGDQGVEKGEQDADQEEKEKDMALHGLIQ